MIKITKFGNLLALSLLFIFSAQAQTSRPEIVSLLGVKHYANADEKGEIEKAQEKLAADADNIDLIIALGRAQANLWRYHDAIETYTGGIKKAPNDARLFRHRGHRYISTRQFDKAVADMKRASELNTHDFDIWYHLGLAHYLNGELVKAAEAYERCHAVAEKDRSQADAKKEGRDDSVIAVSDWLYMTYRRMNKEAEASKVLESITPRMQVKENKSYYDRLLFYKGIKSEADLINVEKAADLEIATVAYGIGNWHLYNGNATKAEEYFRKIVAGKYWPAFGFIAAEAELARVKK